MSEKVILTGYSILLKPVISQIAAIHQLIKNRDVGDIVALPLEEYVRAQPHTIKLTVFFYSIKAPPFKAKKGTKLTRASYNIPDVERAKLTWDAIKEACGGSNGYMWGRFRATANLSNGRQMQVYGSTEKEAEKRLKALLAFSSAKILTLSIAEEKKEGLRDTDKLMYKESTRIYPAYFSIISSEKIITESNREIIDTTPGKVTPTLAGNFRRAKTRKIPLWIDKAPSNTQTIINEAIKTRGVNITKDNKSK